MLTSLDDRMPGWLTIENALWCAIVISIIAAICGVILLIGDRPTGWTAPARDQVDPDESARWDEPRRTPVVWSPVLGDHVCAAAAAELPDEICGWPAGRTRKCPDHGPLVAPGPTHRQVRDDDPDTAYEPADATDHYWSGGAR